MARPFEVAREDEVFDNVEAGEIDVNDVVEETTVVEEETEGNAEVDKQVEALAETAEEAEELISEQEVNEQKLETPEASEPEADSVTEDDVVVSEENLKYHMIRLGYDEGLGERISFAKEAKTSPLTPRERLRISNEAVGDFIAKVISNIKALINKIVISCKKLFAKVLFKFGRYEKKINALKERVNDLGTIDVSKLSKDDKKDYADNLLKAAPGGILGIAIMAMADGNSTISLMNSFEKASKTFIDELIKESKNDAKEVNKKNWFKQLLSKFNPAKRTTINDKVRKYADASNMLPSDFSNGCVIVGLVGKKVYYIPEKIEGKVVKSFDIWSADVPSEAKEDVASELTAKVKEIGPMLNAALGSVKNAKQVFAAFDRNEDAYLKYLKELEKETKVKDAASNRALKLGLDILRVGAAEINLILVRTYISAIKQVVGMSSVVISAAEDADTGDKKDKE